MSDSDAQKAVTNVIVLTTVVSSLVLSARVDSCHPEEDPKHTQIRQAILWLSALALLLGLIKAFRATFPGLQAIQPALDLGYHLLALVVVILNLVYLTNRKAPVTCKDSIIIMDAITNNALMVGVQILSTVSLALMLKRGLWRAGQAKKAGSLFPEPVSAV